MVMIQSGVEEPFALIDVTVDVLKDREGYSAWLKPSVQSKRPGWETRLTHGTAFSGSPDGGTLIRVFTSYFHPSINRLAIVTWRALIIIFKVITPYYLCLLWRGRVQVWTGSCGWWWWTALVSSLPPWASLSLTLTLSLSPPPFFTRSLGIVAVLCH